MEFALYLIAVTLIPSAVTFYLARAAYAFPVWALVGISGLVFVWTWADSTNAKGWDGISYGIIVFFFIMPVFIGFVLGAILGFWWRRRMARRNDPIA
jgi:hypothetical protein